MSYIRLALKILGVFLEWANASDATKKKFLDLVDATQDDGLITVKAQKTFKEQYKKVLEVKEESKG